MHREDKHFSKTRHAFSKVSVVSGKCTSVKGRQWSASYEPPHRPPSKSKPRSRDSISDSSEDEARRRTPSKNRTTLRDIRGSGSSEYDGPRSPPRKGQPSVRNSESDSSEDDSSHKTLLKGKPSSRYRKSDSFEDNPPHRTPLNGKPSSRHRKSDSSDDGALHKTPSKDRTTWRTVRGSVYEARSRPLKGKAPLRNWKTSSSEDEASRRSSSKYQTTRRDVKRYESSPHSSEQDDKEDKVSPRTKHRTSRRDSSKQVRVNDSFGGSSFATQESQKNLERTMNEKFERLEVGQSKLQEKVDSLQKQVAEKVVRIKELEERIDMMTSKQSEERKEHAREKFKLEDDNSNLRCELQELQDELNEMRRAERRRVGSPRTPRTRSTSQGRSNPGMQLQDGNRRMFQRTLPFEKRNFYTEHTKTKTKTWR